MNISKTGTAPLSNLQPGVDRRFLAEDSGYTLVYMYGKAGKGAPPHSHPHQQAVYVLKGTGTFQVGEETAELEPGDCVAIPGNAPHTFSAFHTDMEWLEFFTPRREDIRP